MNTTNNTTITTANRIMTIIGATITTMSVESLELESVTMLVGVVDANIDRESVTAVVVVVVGTLVAVVPVAVI